MDKSPDQNNNGSLFGPPETPRLIRAYRDQIESQGQGIDIFSLDPELLAEVENQYVSQGEELRLLKSKYEELQGEVDRLREENRTLQLTLLSERNQREEVIRNADVKCDQLMVEHRAVLHKYMTEIQQWKLAAESGTKERELLQGQLVTFKREKLELGRKVSEVESRLASDEKHRRNTEVYMRRQKEVLEDLKKKYHKILEAGRKLQEMVNSQQDQMQKIQLICTALDKQKVADDAKIQALEQELIAYKTSNVQLEHKTKLLQISNEEKNKRLAQVENERDNLSKDLQSLVQALDHGMSTKTTELDQVCDILREQVISNLANHQS